MARLPKLLLRKEDESSVKMTHLSSINATERCVDEEGGDKSWYSFANGDCNLPYYYGKSSKKSSSFQH